MAVTQNTYTGNGSATNYSFTFPYLETTDIKVSINGTLTTAYTLANPTTIQFTTAPANGAAIRIYRVTDDSALAATFYSGAAIRATDLNENFTQNLYVTQESSNNASTAITTANSATTTANTALSTANTASTNASAAVATANTASTNASNAVTTANTASTNASNAVTTANAASATANTASTNAATALSTANTASTNASNAVTTANTASTNASTALSTANTAASNASTALSQSNTALSQSSAAVTTANTANTNATAALNAVAAAVQYVLVANVAAIPASPANGYAVEVIDSTGIESFSPVTNRPAGFVGDSGLSVRLQYSTTGPTWNWLGYYANNSENRYLKLSGGTLTGQLKADDSTSTAAPVYAFDGDTNTGVAHTGADELAFVTGGTARLTIDGSGNVAVSGALTKGGNNVVTVGDTGTVTSAMLADGTVVDADISGTAAIGLSKLATGALPTAITVASANIVDGTILNADINASAAIAGTKISPDFGSQTVQTTGIFSHALGTASAPTITFTGDPNTGIYSPGADQVAISTNGTGRLFVDASGNVIAGTTSPVNVRRLHIVDSNIVVASFESTGSIASRVSFKDANTTDNAQNSIGAIGQNLAFWTGNTERMRLDSSGRLGLGTSSVSELFHMKGASPYMLLEGTETNAQTLYIRENAGGMYFGRYGVATRMLIDDQGRVGIGSNNPQSLLHLETDGTALRIVRGSSTGFLYNTGTASTSTTRLQGNDGPVELYTNAAQPVVFSSNTAERARIDSSGRLLVGTSSTVAVGVINSKSQIEFTDYDASQTIKRNTAGDGGPQTIFVKSRGSSNGSNTVVQSGDSMGQFRFYGTDGSAPVEGAAIGAFVDGTPGANDMPGRLVFSTTADGASSPTERLRIQSSGDLRIANSTTFYPATDNAVSLGSGPTGPFRFSAVWAANGTIQTSDERDKTDVVNAQLGSDFIKSLRPVSYKWIEGGKIDTGERDENGNYVYESVPGTRTHWGFIAQEVKEAVDAAGVDFGGWVLTDKDDPDSQQALRYDQFIAPLTKALQETMAELKALKAEVAALKAS